MSQPPYGNQPPYGGQPPLGGPPPSGQPPHGGQPNPGGAPPGWGQPAPGGQPGYGQPPTAGLPSYNQPTQQFAQPAPGSGFGGPPGGQPPFGGPGAPYGPPQPPKKNPLPLIIGGLVLLLVAGGVGLFLILNKDTASTPVANTSTSQSTEDTSGPTEDTSGPTEDTGSPGGGDPNFVESEDVAIAFVQLMIDGDYDTAYSSLCEAGMEMFPDAQALADDFFVFLGATTVTGGQTTDVYPDPEESDRDVVEFDLETDVGNVPMAVSILDENGALTICGYKTP